MRLFLFHLQKKEKRALDTKGKSPRNRSDMAVVVVVIQFHKQSKKEKNKSSTERNDADKIGKVDDHQLWDIA